MLDGVSVADVGMVSEKTSLFAHTICSYVQWIETEATPKDFKVDKAKILENCVLKFREDQQYRNDPRYLSICLQYVCWARMPLIFSSHQPFNVCCESCRLLGGIRAAHFAGQHVF